MTVREILKTDPETLSFAAEYSSACKNETYLGHILSGIIPEDKLPEYILLSPKDLIQELYYTFSGLIEEDFVNNETVTIKILKEFCSDFFINSIVFSLKLLGYRTKIKTGEKHIYFECKINNRKEFNTYIKKMLTNNTLYTSRGWGYNEFYNEKS